MSIKTLTDLRTAVNNDIKTNGVRAITGAILNTQLIDMIDSLESDYVTKDSSLDVRIQSLENMTFIVLQDPLTGWDASSGVFPGGGIAKTGYKWECKVAGTVDGVEFDAGDFIISVTNNASTTTYLNNWVKEDANDRVRSVRGQLGDVTIVPKVNVAVVDPTVNADVSSGYLKGDIWINSSSGDIFICKIDTLGGAVWDKINVPQYVHPNHTGEVTSTGDGAQVLNKTAISNRASETVAADDVFVFGDTSDSDNLKKTTASEIADTRKAFEYEVTFVEVEQVMQLFRFDSSITAIELVNVATLSIDINETGSFTPLIITGTSVDALSLPISLTAGDNITWQIGYASGKDKASLNIIGTKI